MAKLIADSHYDIGGYRDVYEDRVCTRRLTTPGGLRLVLAAVADGVGGENKGERAAQTAIDALLVYLEKSRETEYAALLTQAIQYANKAVFQLQRETRGASTTLTVALVDEPSHRLYVANVGDSRVYICRNQKLTQLSIDHSFANVMAWRGQISPESARSHPRAAVLMRALGAKEEVEVDLGFYVGTTDYQEANARGVEGLPLKDGDAILVCSDGLIKDSPTTHKPLITTEEIIHTLRDKEGKKAAQELISFALGRGPDDNISAAVIQMPDRWRSLRARRPLIYAGVAILSLVVILGIVWSLLRGTTMKLSEISLEGTAIAGQMTAVAGFTLTPTNTPTISPTPTPSPTLTPTLLPPVKNQVAMIYPGEKPLLKREPYQAGTAAGELKIYHRDDLEAGYLFVMPGSGLLIDSAEGEQGSFTFQLRLDPNSQVFLDTGGYSQAYLLMSADLEFALQGCSAIAYLQSPLQVLASCYQGSCQYSLTRGANVDIPVGKRLLVDVTQLTVGELEDIPVSEAKDWISRLPDGSTASNCASQYNPTPTPLPRPTNTPTPKPTRKPSRDSNDSDNQPPAEDPNKPPA
jgi:serine/threonine protein phosphatase PrpC